MPRLIFVIPPAISVVLAVVLWTVDMSLPVKAVLAAVATAAAVQSWLLRTYDERRRGETDTR